LLRIALAKPNARSSHRQPTPQGAGIAVIAATLIAAAAAIALAGAAGMKIPIAVFGATLFIAAVGFADDVHSIPVVPRLSLQGAAVAAVILAAPDSLRLVDACPFWLERGLLFVAGLWFVNLVNFMDGLDLMTVAEIVPITGALVLLGWLGELPAPTTVAAAALFGAMLGFAPFNRPVAKIFLGDVGSLPIGLLVGWCLLQLAGQQQFAAALLLPLYYLADATLTLLRRIVRREPFWAGHRTHFYQRATDNGFTVSRVVSEVFALNILLAALAIGTVMTSSATIAILLFVIGAATTAFLMHRFSRPQPSHG
jgi:UDP-N-acetylmuramyl pentapeptide phosphotransferase/UDP-N-acetylglucosamine-1-phosphate transferase